MNLFLRKKKFTRNNQARFTKYWPFQEILSEDLRNKFISNKDYQDKYQGSSLEPSCYKAKRLIIG